MTKKRTHRRHDPLVAVRRDRLRAAVDRRGIGQRELAARIGQPQSRLSHLLTGRVRRCRESVLAALADALRVPVKWLSGQTERFPFLPYDPKQPVALPALSDLVVSEFVTRAVRAWRRDQTAAGETPTGTPMMWLARSLIDPAHWRGFLVEDGKDYPLTADEVDAATEGLATAFAIVLRPWLAGKAEVNLGELAGATHHAPG